MGNYISLLIRERLATCRVSPLISSTSPLLSAIRLLLRMGKSSQCQLRAWSLPYGARQPAPHIHTQEWSFIPDLSPSNVCLFQGWLRLFSVFRGCERGDEVLFSRERSFIRQEGYGYELRADSASFMSRSGVFRTQSYNTTHQSASFRYLASSPWSRQ